MARGWESKAIEAQQDDAARARQVKPVLSAADREVMVRRRTLEMTRARVADELSRATVAHHRTMLEKALSELDAQLQALS